MRTRYAVEADEPVVTGVAWEICIDDGDVVAMTHRAKCVKQFGRQDRINELQHGVPPFGGLFAFVLYKYKFAVKGI
jgi:hypothetical protein